ncbi:MULTISPECIES: toll/interleukin-1 receptor domain-containing protein [unclassified Pseudomonas]|uniref:toll/interleukin-1 receptor domain-containing protein n=1 Tax=unclassified Pseudomonas TaxID=196821 RepID=UPI00244CFDC9|nr:MULTISPECIES: toll/interleukin-1 receptor domain-containing protein [unclassified Pseudomonas]MDH0892899.1 toll/interleukin-1 receptor domain-containing protein [Pseudomonas sp. GD03875]MDH1064627.1 toll/interleukin-1 receptor domain-containing protein [Pseudomonas sp. GD03985]
MAISQAALQRRMREAQRKIQQELKREVNRVNRENKQRVVSLNRQIDMDNRKVQSQLDAYNRRIDAYNRRVESEVSSHNRRVAQHNAKVIAELNRSLRSSTSALQYSDSERRLADRVHQAVAFSDLRDYDSFLSYARIDGSSVAGELRDCLEALGVAVWFDEVAIVPGRSQSLQMDSGLRKARTGIALLTPTYLTGRFWTERELGALFSKPTLIPVLHGVTFEDVKKYSGILPDLAGFTTEHDSVPQIAEKIAAAVLPRGE